MSNATFSFFGKRVLVTGAIRGIGFAIANAFAKCGASLCITDYSDAITDSAIVLKKSAEEWAEKNGHQVQPVHVVRADLRDATEREQLICECVKFLGGIDILVNNAGVQIRHRPEDFPLSDFEAVMDVNLTAVFDLCRLAGKEMLKQGSGKIINLASMLSYFGGTTVPAYAASKGGVAQLTKALANDWASSGINVNAVAPGYIDTDMNAALIANNVRFTEIVSRIPTGRFGTPDEIAPPVLFLASDAARYINGAIIPIDGGYLGR
ncbi:MAG: SDR family oxidoreductase [Clostridia bacterium]|nr:SDR family oxidoreductase [Clostridia bacterium]